MPKTSSALIAVVLVLLAIGIVMLASTSSVRGEHTFDDPLYFLKRQLVWLGVALAIGVVAARFDYHWWQRLALPLAGGAVALLVVVLLPGFGARVGGSSRWLRLGPIGMQPSEFAKFATVIVMASWMAAMASRVERFREGLLYPLLWLALVLGLMMLEPDFGTTALTGLVGMGLLFAGGTRLSYLAVTGALGAGAFGYAVMRDPVRLGRIMAFLLPKEYPATAYHLTQSKYAFIGGGLFGVGLGNSMQKHFYLPEAHTDFILAIIGEEFGFAATLLVLLLFVGVFVCGMTIAFKAPDTFGRLIAFGFTLMLILQTAINVGVVTGCLPTKGLALPFISYGGSSLVVSVLSVCVLLNVASHVGNVHEDDHTRSIKDQAHEF